MPPLDTRVGHQLEEQHESNNSKDDGGDMQEKRHCLAEKLCFRQKCTESLQEDVQATGDNYDKWNENEDTTIVKDLAVNSARTFDEPDSIECLFYI